jgi:DNA helicase-2/ATP-dependent DNA helicase PcrA
VVGVPPHGVLAVTFTNKARREMRGRVEALLRDGTRGMWIGTFHGWRTGCCACTGARPALPEVFQVMDSDDQLR